MKKQKQILLISEPKMFDKSQRFCGFEYSYLWIDRISGGVLSQYLKNHLENTKSDDIDLIWIHGTSKDYSDIFVWIGKGEFPFARVKQVISDAETKRAYWTGDFSVESQKKAKKIFREFETLKVPEPWTEDIVDVGI